MKPFKIAIDGPAGSGKSTVAKKLAEKLHFLYIDTGAMYRSIAWKALEEAGSVERITSALLETISKNSQLNMTIDDQNRNHFYIDQIEVTEAIRSPEVNRAVSEVAKNKYVREALVSHQRELGRNQPVVMDGRDIGTFVFPNAELKFFLTASARERAVRRWKELKTRGENVNLDELEKEIAARDTMDERREIAPLIPAEDAIQLDTTNLSIDQVVDKLITLYEEKRK